MRELGAIISAYEQAQSKGLECVLASVIHVEGSSYRKAGARMLVDENGVMTGAISGGCLEGDALRKALHALHQRKKKLITYDTSDESGALIGAQLGCNGVIQVLFEPLDQSDMQNPIELLKKVSEATSPLVIATLFDLEKMNIHYGTVQLIDSFSNRSGKRLSTEIEQQLTAHSKQVFRNEQGSFYQYIWGDHSQHIFLEYYTPPPNLVLVGAGNDAQVLAEMAEILGWKITVTDGRPSHANINRFVSSCQVVVSKPEQVLENISTDQRTYFVLMSHNYNYDLAVLKVLLAKPEIPYIGLLGPKSKFDRMIKELDDENIPVSEKQMNRIFTPIGLNIGAETPAEIALAILAEIQSVITQSAPQRLRDKNGPIHDKQQPDFKIIQL